MISDLPDLKTHLRVDGDEEDRQIAAYALAAERQIADWIGRPVYRFDAVLPVAGDARYHPDQMVADDAIRVSVMMMVDRMYHNRGGEGGSAEAATPPMSVRAMLAGHRVFTVSEEE